MPPVRVAAFFLGSGDFTAVDAVISGNILENIAKTGDVVVNSPQRENVAALGHGKIVPQAAFGTGKTDFQAVAECAANISDFKISFAAASFRVPLRQPDFQIPQDSFFQEPAVIIKLHRLTPEEYRDMNEDLKKEQYELEWRSELLTEADEKFSIAVATILSLGNNAYQIFQNSKVETKREILHLLLSNLKLQDRKISYTLRKPYDYIRSLNKKHPPKRKVLQLVMLNSQFTN